MSWDVGQHGLTYIGSRFEDASDFIEKYQFLDMLQASLFHFPSWEEVGRFQSRFIALNYLDQPVGQSYVELLEMLKTKLHTILLRADKCGQCVLGSRV